MIEWTKQMLNDLGKLNDRQVAEKYSISIGTVYQKRKYLRIPPSRQRASYKKVSTDQVLELIDKGMSQTDAAKTLNTSRQNVVHHLWKAGRNSKGEMQFARTTRCEKEPLIRLIGSLASEDQLRGFLKTLL